MGHREVVRSLCYHFMVKCCNLFRTVIVRRICVVRIDQKARVGAERRRELQEAEDEINCLPEPPQS